MDIHFTNREKLLEFPLLEDVDSYFHNDTLSIAPLALFGGTS